MSNKNVIRINESLLKQIIKETVQNVLSEGYDTLGQTTGYLAPRCVEFEQVTKILIPMYKNLYRQSTNANDDSDFTSIDELRLETANKILEIIQSYNETELPSH